MQGTLVSKLTLGPLCVKKWAQIERLGFWDPNLYTE